MKSLGIYVSLFFFIAGVGGACSSDQPTVDDAQRYIEKMWEKSVKSGELRIINIKKTDGRSSEVFGVKKYDMQYEAELEWPNGGFHYGRKYPGDRETVTGEIEFSKSEKGWQADRWTRGW